jgi:hypothetical protein
MYEFKKLSKEKTISLLAKLKITDSKVSTEMTLADIYNHADCTAPSSNSKSIGFLS